MSSSTSKNILTLEEAMASLQTDNDFDGRIKSALPAIDIEIFLATGVKWEREYPVYPLAKSVAEITLRLNLGMSTNEQQDIARKTSQIIQLKAEARINTRGARDDEE